MVAPAAVPIYVAAMGPANLRLTGELADGWLGNAFVPESAGTFLDPIRDGARTAGRELDDLDLVAPVAVEFTADDDEADEAAKRHARGYAFTIGAMGTGGRNFYNDAFARLGFAEEVATVQALWKSGRRDAAADAVPVELGRTTNLLGTEPAVAERVERYRGAGITTLLAKLDGGHDEQLVTLERLVRLVAG
jgi:alkanesulfonate monooxygenase SsuD/methylene tetrahydromethanopterin reductase-like flavin-dependent oxidoreductase (luciferase family)